MILNDETGRDFLPGLFLSESRAKAERERIHLGGR